MKKSAANLIIAAVCVLVAAVLMFALVGYSFMAYCFLAVAAVSLLYMAFGMLKGKNEKLFTTLSRILTYAIILFAIAFAITEAAIISEVRSTAGGDAEYAIVLGAGVKGTTPSRSLTARLETALKFAEENPQTYLVVSGGQGENEDISEAECMKKWLVAHGVDDSRILLEDKSQNTVQNIRYSAEVIKANGGNLSDRVYIITEGYHVLRAKVIAMDNGFESVSTKAAYTGLPILTANYYMREVVAMWYYMLIR
jgi:uncharacterized SAM-binding protein YcdF (DUF218 family)